MSDPLSPAQLLDDLIATILLAVNCRQSAREVTEPARYLADAERYDAEVLRLKSEVLRRMQGLGVTCWLWFHKWGRWVPRFEGTITHNGGRVGYQITQEQTCERCGKKRLHVAVTTVRGKA